MEGHGSRSRASRSHARVAPFSIEMLLCHQGQLSLHKALRTVSFIYAQSPSGSFYRRMQHRRNASVSKHTRTTFCTTAGASCTQERLLPMPLPSLPRRFERLRRDRILSPRRRSRWAARYTSFRITEFLIANCSYWELS